MKSFYFNFLGKFKNELGNFECLSMSITNTIPRGKCFVRCICTHFCIRNLRQQLVRKYRTPGLSSSIHIFPFRKGPLSFNTDDATMGNQALVMIDVILYTLVFPGSSYKKANTFLNSFRDNDVAAQV